MACALAIPTGPLSNQHHGGKGLRQRRSCGCTLRHWLECTEHHLPSDGCEYGCAPVAKADRSTHPPYPHPPTEAAAACARPEEHQQQHGESMTTKSCPYLQECEKALELEIQNKNETELTDIIGHRSKSCQTDKTHMQFV